MANNTDEIKKIKKEVKTIEDTLAEILKIVKADEKDKPNEAKEQGLDEDKVKELFNEMMSKVNANLSVESPKKEVLGMDRDVLFISLCLGALSEIMISC